MLHIAAGQDFVDRQDLDRLRDEASEICRMLSGLKRSALDKSG